jgi:hypothetical protein
MKTGMATESVGASISDIGAMVGVGTESHAGGWHDIVSRVSGYVSGPKTTSPTGQESLTNLSGLLRLQLDVAQYQLRVEVVSKVAESAVASLRKLQQPQ